MRLRIAPVAIALPFLAGCATARVAPEVQGAPSPSSVASYFPLAVGNSWTYETRFGGREETNTVSIVADEGGVFTDSRGNRFAVDSEGLRDDRRYLLKMPLSRGTTWKSIPEVGRVEIYEITDTAATVAVPAGTFEDVILVRGRTRVDPGTEIEVEWAYAPGVGLVRIVTAARIGREQIPQGTTELSTFEVRRSGLPLARRGAKV